MDPQLEEYRRKQRERAQAQATDVAHKNRKSKFGIGAGLVFVCVVAAATMQNSSGGGVLAEEVPEVPEMQAREAPSPLCPEPDGVGTCVEGCSGDADCTGGQLCCSNGCGHECMDPVDPNKPRPAGPCTLIAVVGKEHWAEAVANIPAPEDKQELGGIGMLILKYGVGRDTECCEAAEILHKGGIAKSVEYDGRPPSCAAEWALPKQHAGLDPLEGQDMEVEMGGDMGVDEVGVDEVGLDAMGDMGIEEGL